MGSDVYGLPSRETYPDSQSNFDVAKIGNSFITSKFSGAFLCCFPDYSYLCTIACKPLGGERAVLYMRKTFSDVCRCGPRTSQLPNLQQADGNGASTWCVSIYLFIYSSYWRGLTALSILCRWAMRRPLDPGWAEETGTCAFFVS